MQRTIQDFLSVAFSALCFCPFFLAPGYLFAFVFNLNSFRERSLPERILWSTSLSTPLSILFTVFAGRHLSFHTSQAVTFVFSLALAILLLWQKWKGRLTDPAEWDQPVRLALVGAFLLSLYCILATLGITIGNKLYEGTYAGDWSVRIPLTAAAQRSGVPIMTPFYGIGGESLPLRYYYYWYVLCGAVARIAHGTARSALAASSVWSALALFSTLFLFAKYLFPPTAPEKHSFHKHVSLRKFCLYLFPVSCILGLDIIPSIISIMMRPIRLYPEMEWWRSAGDFSLSFHTAILYAPHHTAGLVCCMLGFLMLTLVARQHDTEDTPWSHAFIYAVVAALCFAAAVGTSTYLTLIFSIACTTFALERAQQRDWRAIAAITVAGVLALTMSTSYLREILAGAGTSLHSGDTHVGHAKFIALFPRNVGLPRIELLQLGSVFKYERLTPWWIKALMRPMLTALLYLAEIGFFGFVFAWRAWSDYFAWRRLTIRQRMQWALVLALAFSALFLSSQPVIGVNDLGRHAGLALRFVAVLWATPLFLRAKYDHNWFVSRKAWLRHTIVGIIVLGLCSQLWQMTVQRTYFWLIDHGTIVRPFAPFPRFSHYGSRYFEARQAFEALNRAVPASGRVQFNPGSTTLTLMGDYLERPVAAFDVDCQVPFGGDLKKCHEAMPAIRGIFGGGHPIAGTVQEFDPTGVTPEAFRSLCLEHHLKALVATASDRIWPEKQSWLWTQRAIFTNASTRVVLCPAVPFASEAL